MTTFIIVILIIIIIVAFLYWYFFSADLTYNPDDIKSHIKLSKTEEKRYKEIAYKFSKFLTTGNFEKAFELLETNYIKKWKWSASLLREKYEKMIEYSSDPATNIEVIEYMNDWSGKKNGDIGWAYVTIESGSYTEAVTVIVCNESEKYKIRDIEWGRP